MAAFLMGALLTAMLAFSLRRWLPGRDIGVELVRKDAEIARKDTELSRKDAQIAGLEAKLAILDGRLLEEERHVTGLRRQNAALVDDSASSTISAERYAAIEARCAKLSAENHQLQQDRQSIEADAADLRTRLKHALTEAAHWARWLKVYDEENARLTEMGSPPKG